MLLKFLTKYANGYLCAMTGYYPSCEYAETGKLWKDYDEEEYVDYSTWLKDAKNSPNTTERIKAQTAQVNIDTYVKAEEKWTKFVDQPFPGSASIRVEVANAPKYLFIDGNTPQEAIDKVLVKLPDYIKK